MTCRFAIIVLGTEDREAEQRTTDSLREQRLSGSEVTLVRADDRDAVLDALRRSEGEFVAFLDAGDTLEPDALATIDELIDDDVDLLYSDEDVLTARIHSDPFLKPDWSPDRLANQHYTGRLTLMRSRLLRDGDDLVDLETGSAYEYELVLRLGAVARRIVHVARVLCHRGARPTTSTTRIADATRVLEAHFARVGAHLSVDRDASVESIVVRPRLRDTPAVSVIIPTAGVARRVRGQVVPLVVNCVSAVVERSTYEHFDITCVYDDSMEPQTLQAIAAVGEGRVSFVPYHDQFNFSRKINIGALASAGDHLLLLNDDVEVITPDWIERMLAQSLQPGVGAVGALLKFADARIQHAGVILNGGNPGHSFYLFPGDHPGYCGNLEAVTNLSAVTAACLMTPRTCFEQVGGLATEFPRNYNDVDYCLKLGTAGYRVVLDPRVEHFHYESSSRGLAPVEPHELALLRHRWGSRLDHDPYYNPNFLPGDDFATLIDPLGRTPVEAGLPQ